MADFDLEEWQRQQAAAAVAASQGQPNAIPTQPPTFTNAAARVAAPTGNGQVLLGSPGGSSVDALNRPRPDWGTPTAPNPAVDPAYAQRGLPITGEQNASGFTGADTVQGVISPSEQQFWANNQNGAIPHPVTGQLIGLGNDASARQKVFQDLTPPSQIAESTLPSPNFIPVPEVDPAVGARREEIANEIATTQNQLRGASTERGRHGQPSSFDTLSTKLEQLRHADSGLAQHEHQTEVFRAHVTDQNRKMQDEYNVNRDASSANIAMGRITAAPGTDEYKAAMAKIDNDYPYARQDPRVSAAMLKAATFHDERADIAARAQAAGLQEKIVGYGQKGPTVQFVNPTDEATKQADKDLKPYGLAHQNIINPVAVMVGRIGPVDNDGNPLTPEQIKTAKTAPKQDFINDSSGNIVSINTGKKQNAHVPIDVYLKHGGKLSAEDQAAQTRGAAPQVQGAAQTQTDTQGLRISSDTEFNALPSGSIFTDPNGVKRRKP